MSKQYHYDHPVWGDVLTGVSEITYSNTSTATYSLRNENAFANQVLETQGDGSSVFDNLIL